MITHYDAHVLSWLWGTKPKSTALIMSSLRILWRRQELLTQKRARLLARKRAGNR